MMYLLEECYAPDQILRPIKKLQEIDNFALLDLKKILLGASKFKKKKRKQETNIFEQAID